MGRVILFSKILSKILKSKKNNCLLITPPLLEPNTYYLAMPLLVGQLLQSGYSAKNLDLNIRFFRTVLSVNYIEQTKKKLDLKNILYDQEYVDFLVRNIEKALNDYVFGENGGEEYIKAQEVIESVLKFISLPYTDFELNKLTGFENSFIGFDYVYQKIKEISFDEEKNIFINFFDNIINEIIEQDVSFVGITIPFPGTIIPAFTLARLLKEKTDVHVALGGNLLKSDQLIDFPEIFDIYCDSVLIGDGEKSIVELLMSIENKQNKKSVSGLIYKNRNNQVCYNPSKPITKMNNIANISLEGINLKEYMTKHPNIYLMASKGCYWGKCSFCGLATKYRQYCTMPPEELVSKFKEIKQKYQAEGWFLLQDDSIPPGYLSKLADEIIKQGVEVYYGIFARLEKSFDRELLEKLYKSGLRTIYWGLESGCQKTLDEMNKGIKIDNVYQILKDSYEVGIDSMAGIIVNFPTETMQDHLETIEFLKTVKEYVRISPGEFCVMKNTIVEQHNEEYGVKISALNRDRFDYYPGWEHAILQKNEQQKKWENFCKFVKNENYSVDENKRL